MKQKNNLPKIKSYKSLALLNGLIAFLMISILYFLLPSILNYPPNTIDNDFQISMVGIKYTHQFMILACIIVALIYFSLRFVYRKISYTEKDNKASILKLRKKCFNYPYVMIVLQSFLPPIICGILLVVFKTNFELLVRICIVIFSFSTIFSIGSYMLGKNFFEGKLKETSKIAENKKGGVRLEIYKKLLIQTLPLFLYSFVILLLISTTIMTTEKGDLLYHFYRQELIKEFSDKDVYTLAEIEERLNSISLYTDKDHYVILSCTDGSVYYSKETLNDFFIQYTLQYYDEMEGHTFEYYGQDSQASLFKVSTTEGDFFVGIRFFVFGSDIITPFIIVVLLLTIFNMFFIFYIGKGLSKDIKNVNEGMDHISNSENIVLANDLPITSNDEMADLTLSFNNVQNVTRTYVAQIHDNQDKLMEKERLASLGQLIGGIAHNLKTPIMSISGAAEGLSDLIKEYDTSIEDPEVNSNDHHDIAKDMTNWVQKIKSYTEYMSDVITAVKGQAVTLSDQQTVSFTIEELVKRVDILMKHELKNALINLKVSMKVEPTISLNGNVNSLVQVLNNMISNSIQAYNGKTDQTIEFIITKKDENIIFTIEDHAGGLPKEVAEKLFKEMITTKGKNGTGLGLFMSYSNIRAHFNGNITFETKRGKGTSFHIILPLNIGDVSF